MSLNMPSKDNPCLKVVPGKPSPKTGNGPGG